MSKAKVKADGTAKWFQLKVTLLYAQPSLWRRILVPAALKLPKVHAVLQTAFGWENRHLHAFRSGDESYEVLTGEMGDEIFEPGDRRDEGKFSLSDLLGKEGDSLIYEYDFGDSWELEVTLEKVQSFEEQALIMCVAGARAAPPEDCGGVPGYEELVEAMAKPRHPRRAEFLEWLGPFDPEAFPLAAINAKLKRMKY